jgi:hypothetical protein
LLDCTFPAYVPVWLISDLHSCQLAYPHANFEHELPGEELIDSTWAQDERLDCTWAQGERPADRLLWANDCDCMYQMYVSSMSIWMDSCSDYISLWHLHYVNNSVWPFYCCMSCMFSSVTTVTVASDMEGTFQACCGLYDRPSPYC